MADEAKKKESRQPRKTVSWMTKYHELEASGKAVRIQVGLAVMMLKGNPDLMQNPVVKAVVDCLEAKDLDGKK